MVGRIRPAVACHKLPYRWLKKQYRLRAELTEEFAAGERTRLVQNCAISRDDKLAVLTGVGVCCTHGLLTQTGQ